MGIYGQNVMVRAMTWKEDGPCVKFSTAVSLLRVAFFRGWRLNSDDVLRSSGFLLALFDYHYRNAKNIGICWATKDPPIGSRTRRTHLKEPWKWDGLIVTLWLTWLLMLLLKDAAFEFPTQLLDAFCFVFCFFKRMAKSACLKRTITNQTKHSDVKSF